MLTVERTAACLMRIGDARFTVPLTYRPTRVATKAPSFTVRFLTYPLTIPELATELSASGAALEDPAPCCAAPWRDWIAVLAATLPNT